MLNSLSLSSGDIPTRVRAGIKNEEGNWESAEAKIR